MPCTADRNAMTALRVLRTTLVALGLTLTACGCSSLAPATDAGADVGGSSPAAPEAGVNVCGGMAALVYQGGAAAPADPCGPCGDGVLVCASPNLVACAGALPASVCADAAVLVDSGDASDATDSADGTVTEAGGDTPNDGGARDAAEDAAADASFAWPTCSGAADGGDAAASDAAVVDGAASDGAADDASADAASGRTLAQVLTGATWSVGQSVAGMAVDSQNRVYLSDLSNVYVYVCGQLLIYMTAAEVAAIVGSPVMQGIQDMDIAPDGSLYILLSQGIVHSTAPHTGDLFQLTSSLTSPHRLGAITNGSVAVTDSDGMTVFTSTGGYPVYSGSQIGSPSDCAVEDLTTDPSGVFLYNVGCDGSPLLRGNVSGSGVWILFDDVGAGRLQLHLLGT